MYIQRLSRLSAVDSQLFDLLPSLYRNDQVSSNVNKVVFCFRFSFVLFLFLFVSSSSATVPLLRIWRLTTFENNTYSKSSQKCGRAKCARMVTIVLAHTQPTKLQQVDALIQDNRVRISLFSFICVCTLTLFLVLRWYACTSRNESDRQNKVCLSITQAMAVVGLAARDPSLESLLPVQLFAATRHIKHLAVAVSTASQGMDESQVASVNHLHYT